MKENSNGLTDRAEIFRGNDERLSLSEGLKLSCGGPWGTVPELLFEKKELIPALQQLLVAESIC